MGPMDTLLYDESGKVNTATMQTILRSAGLDPTNPRAMRKCGKCGNDKVRQVRSLGEMRLINICEKCSKSWIDVPEKE
jgi:DNA-directed RNA polymerase subunit M/transcription elongation factor TFIIS